MDFFLSVISYKIYSARANFVIKRKVLVVHVAAEVVCLHLVHRSIVEFMLSGAVLVFALGGGSGLQNSPDPFPENMQNDN